MRSIGLHLRWTQTILEALQTAIALEVPIFQSFLVSQETERYLIMPLRDQALFRSLRRQHAIKGLFLHASYRINLGDKKQTHYLLDRELAWAERLNFTHIVLHPGAASRGATREETLDTIASALNDLCARELPVNIILENVAYAGKAFGGDLCDLAALRQKMDYPEKIGFCIDTAHAYSYGYDLACAPGLQDFVAHSAKTLGLNNVALIHCNDTNAICGTRIDDHTMLGQGRLGEDALRTFVMQTKLVNVPCILELPIIGIDEQKKILQVVRAWHHK